MFRGKGHGRGGYGYGSFAKEEKYEVFPEIQELPDVNHEQKNEEFTTLVEWSDAFRKFWRQSPYYLVDSSLGGTNKRNVIRRPPLSDYMIMTTDHFPAELVANNVMPTKKKKTQWDLQLDLQRLDIFEKLDQKTQGKDDEKKEEEEEDDENENFDDEEDDLDDDYGQGEYCDDDEDDFNMDDRHEEDDGCY